MAALAKLFNVQENVPQVKQTVMTKQLPGVSLNQWAIIFPFLFKFSPNSSFYTILYEKVFLFINLVIQPLYGMQLSQIVFPVLYPYTHKK